MKNTLGIALVIAVAVCTPAFGQHGHGAGAGGGMAMGSHAGGNQNASAGGPAAVHGETMTQLLTKNTQLSDKIASLTGQSAQDACSGFKNLGQCVAAAHVSKNLGINFACLKSDMTGKTAASGSGCPAATNTATTSSKGMSLGKSIQALSPTANSKSEAKKAQQQAAQDLKNS